MKWSATLLLMWVMTQPVWALTLDDARQQGRVGETLSGYLAARQQDNDTLKLVKRINADALRSISGWRSKTISPRQRWPLLPVKSW